MDVAVAKIFWIPAITRVNITYWVNGEKIVYAFTCIAAKILLFTQQKSDVTIKISYPQRVCIIQPYVQQFAIL
jgi:hypothetical protein